LFGCSGDEPSPKLEGINPGRAYSNEDVRVTLNGSGFIPAFRIDPRTDQRVAVMDGFSGRIGKGSAWAPLSYFGWLGPETITATLRSEDVEDLIRTQTTFFFDVEITDPRGRKAVLENAFEELGRDNQPPSITFESPVVGINYCPGSTLNAHFTVTEEAPGSLTSVAWQLSQPDLDPISGFCPVEPDATLVDCAFDLPINSDLSVTNKIFLTVTAFDSGRNRRVEQSTVILVDCPSIKSIAPSFGPSTGGTDIAITGGIFPSDSRVYFGDDDRYPLFPNGGRVIDKGNTITGYTPAHLAGRVKLRVVSRMGEVSSDVEFKDPDPKVEQ
jgi:hypothetical protein